jgi:hypothetical protein
VKNYKKIYSFGCSFTEGGGLNNQNFHRYIKGDKNYSSVPETILPEHTKYACSTSYPGQLSKLLNCEVENYGTSRAANELIFNMAYEKINGLKNTENILVTIQTSLLSRMLIQIPDQNKSITINNLIGTEDNIKTFYELYICNFFDINYACKKLIQEIDAYHCWFTHKNIDVVWILYEMNLEKNSFVKPFVVNFDGVDLMKFASDNKLTLSDLPNFPYNDKHFSPEGHKVIANKIFEHLKTYD